MLNHRIVSTIFLISLAIIGVGYAFDSWPSYYFAVAFGFYTIIEAWGSFALKNNYFTKSICSFETDEKEIVLTFDDGPDREVTPAVLYVLQKWDVPATFFCIGKKVEQEPALVRCIFEDGHAIGLHSHSHSYFYDFYSYSGFKKDLIKNQDVIQEIIGHRPRFFRPPYGVTTPFMHRAVTSLRLTVIGWSIRSLDTLIKDENKLYNRVVQRVEPGAILLLHDHLTSTPRLLDRLLEYLKEEDYRVVSLVDAINKSPYAN